MVWADNKFCPKIPLGIYQQIGYLRTDRDDDLWKIRVDRSDSERGLYSFAERNRPQSALIGVLYYNMQTGLERVKCKKIGEQNFLVFQEKKGGIYHITGVSFINEYLYVAVWNPADPNSLQDRDKVESLFFRPSIRIKVLRRKRSFDLYEENEVNVETQYANSRPRGIVIGD